MQCWFICWSGFTFVSRSVFLFQNLNFFVGCGTIVVRNEMWAQIKCAQKSDNEVLKIWIIVRLEKLLFCHQFVQFWTFKFIAKCVKYLQIRILLQNHSENLNFSEENSLLSFCGLESYILFKFYWALLKFLGMLEKSGKIIKTHKHKKLTTNKTYVLQLMLVSATNS